MSGPFSRTCKLVTFVALGAIAAQAQQTGQSLQPTIREDRVTRAPAGTQNGKPDEPSQNVPSGRTMNTVLSSTEDLNSIRDAYLRRLSGDGCAPDVAVRAAELRSRLHDDAANAGTQRSSADIERAMLALASDWYAKPLGEAPAAAAATREAERAKLLDAALAPADSPAAAETTDPAQLRAELDRLLAGCRSAAR